jgi:signal transduction histidine kinase
MGQLLAGVAHEVRNPLAGISSSAQVLIGRFEPRDERTRFVRAILDEVNRLDRIVTRLLQFARPGEPRLQRGSLEQLVRRVIESNSDWLNEAQVETAVVIGSRVPEVWFDPDLIYQVILNLVHNAVQAMPDGGRLGFEVRIVRRRSSRPGPGRRRGDAEGQKIERKSVTRQMVQVRVVDTGEGVSKEAMPQLFDPFFTTKATGTGLGLSICQSIIQEHGGTIQVASRRDRGTTVIFELPVEKRQGERRSA